MRIIVAEDIGFCSGVRRALKMTLSEINENEKIYTLGEIVHNKTVVDSLRKRGVNVLQENIIPEDAKNSSLIIRAHGISRDQLFELQKVFKKIVDTTCPIVHNLFQTASRIHQEGYRIVVFGKESHPEMSALKGYVKDATITLKPPELSGRICIMSQTTMSIDEFYDFVVKSISQSKFSEIRIINTVCEITARREKEAQKIAKQVDLMIIIGGKNSSNTSKLTKIASKFTRAIQIETPEEVDKINFDKVEMIGITTGTSTPEEDVKTVIDKIKCRRERK
ncbi:MULTISPECIES: 4-hydroxy-3-methylbut-2-enyl diphosphate reductase [Pseudothermotoga]|uniref:4-hydroxy-3-methylbut-2-enyl diphosphate reductase n=1 Tax=Pseudothermotoga lettingae (strain ATCC BAA-301 / DSM 14385 / NBRC 107922 / TMO) TaxID=416591 RepID=ISPH_PSELT|nr:MULTISPECIES: 4-hydroxy-3-methylbut-2-enyl diphosphate reductase [Pseudothermotoga]A8F7S0.1 RecName: Full=4-hydroxy-3-methylbut-2-enyl diphosphate reductase; Short=HMBPP reductase [Pseudothermotoga lettingae TMO]ABV34204.1 hydroxymethylbutenyl pyrophosphate reductase [Pseudothermotoga lettingae TMO]KUK21138.1 MAG: 4-hydroxy-3-methylbut-2-enyl diphosphate reductase [Pseudothermotoga lettingae]MDI3494476.1 4-hydroxy-3-methylbut-2-en-yl diphosphate reductase [Pseudothermotoga sp.]MDK2884810.1 